MKSTAGKVSICLFVIFMLPVVCFGKSYDITKYGAVADGKTVNTKAIQKAIDTCEKKGGGVVVVPKGIFITGSIFLKQDVDLNLKEGAVLKASENRKDFKVIVNLWAGMDKPGPAALVNVGQYKGYGLKNVRIYGKGTLDGSGAKWWKEFWDNYHDKNIQAVFYGKGQEEPKGWYNYSKLITVCNSDGVVIEGIHLKDSSFWNLHLLYCNDVVIRNVDIYAPIAPVRAPSSDGIDVDSSTNVLIEGCTISVADDCIALKSGRDARGLLANRPTENVIIRNCRFGAGHGVIVCGSEISGGIRNLHAYNCVMDGIDKNNPSSYYPNPIVRFKTAPGRGAVVENILVENFYVKNAPALVSFQIPFGKDPAWKESFKKHNIPLEKGYTKLRNITIRNITGQCETPGWISGYNEITVENVLIENICVEASKGDAFEVGQAKGVEFRNIRVNGKQVNQRGDGEPKFKELNGCAKITGWSDRIPRDGLPIIGKGTMWLVRQTIESDQHKMSWETRAVPEKIDPSKNYTFKWIASMGFTSQPSGSFTLMVGDKKLLDFDVVLENTSWSSADSKVTLKYDVLKKVGTEDRNGMMTLTVPGSMLTAGEPLELKVVGSDSKSRRWFGIYQSN